MTTSMLSKRYMYTITLHGEFIFYQGAFSTTRPKFGFSLILTAFIVLSFVIYFIRFVNSKYESNFAG